MQRVVLCLCTLAAAACGAARAEPLSYDYAYLSHQQNTVNGRNFNNDTVGGYIEIGHHAQVFASWGDAGLYGNPAWHNSRAIRVGAGGHFLLDADTMIAPEAAIVRARFDNALDQAVKDTGYEAKLELRHRFTYWLEAIASGRHSDVLDQRANAFVAGPVFHLNRYLAVGTFYQSVEGDAGWELTARWYF